VVVVVGSDGSTSIVLVFSEAAEGQFAQVCDAETHAPEVIGCAVRLREKMAAGSVERLVERSALLPVAGEGLGPLRVICRGPVAFLFRDAGGAASHVVEVVGVFELVSSVPLAAFS
jgi:hypothetical protein